MMKSLNRIPAKSLISSAEWVIWLRSNTTDLMNQDPPTHWGLFLSCDVFLLHIYIPLNPFYFI